MTIVRDINKAMEGASSTDFSDEAQKLGNELLQTLRETFEKIVTDDSYISSRQKFVSALKKKVGKTYWTAYFKFRKNWSFESSAQDHSRAAELAKSQSWSTDSLKT